MTVAHAPRPPREILAGAFKSLLPDVSFRSDGEPISPLGPGELAEVRCQGAVTVNELLVLWAYLLAVGMKFPTLAAKAKEMQDALLAPVSFQTSLCKAITPEMLAVVHPVDLIKNPPPALVQAITDAVITHAKENLADHPLTGLESAAFMHTGDRFFLGKLQALPAGLVGQAVDLIKRRQELMLMADAILTSPRHHPRLHRIYAQAGLNLGWSGPLPPLYIAEGGLNAYTTGCDKPMVVIMSGAISLLDDRELMFILGHELGHVMAGHVLYHSLGMCLLGIGASAVAFAGIVLQPLVLLTEPLMTAWSRRSEFTADRAGLLACQDREAALRVMIKLSGHPIRNYAEINSRSIVEQCRKFEEALDGSAMDSVFDFVGKLTRDHPYAVLRATAMIDWMENGAYDEIVLASESERRQLALTNRQLGGPEASLRDEIVAVLTRWVAGRFALSPRDCRVAIRRAFTGTDTQAILGRVLKVEMRGEKVSATEVVFQLSVLFHENGQAKVAKLAPSISRPWEDTPEELRAEMIQTNRPVVRVFHPAV